jgi:nucleotide-binding universal stress UspA family protein
MTACNVRAQNVVRRGGDLTKPAHEKPRTSCVSAQLPRLAQSAAFACVAETPRLRAGRWSPEAREERLRHDIAIAPGEPSQRIAATARELDVDIVVRATRGSAGGSQPLLGRVTERVVRTASCPVLTVPI